MAIQLAAGACIGGRAIAGPVLRLGGGTAAVLLAPVTCARAVDQRRYIGHRSVDTRPMLPGQLGSVGCQRLRVICGVGGTSSGPSTLGEGLGSCRRSQWSQWRQQRAALSASAARRAAGGGGGADDDVAGGASYWVLEVQPEASDAEVRHAFYRLVLGLDEDDPEDHELFRQLAQAYRTLHPDANPGECKNIKVALAAALKDVDIDAEGRWMAATDDGAPLFFEDGEIPEGYFDDDYADDDFKISSELADTGGDGGRAQRARDLTDGDGVWDIADPNNSSPRDGVDYADELLAGDFEEAFGDDLQPWEIGADAPAGSCARRTPG